jgi:hypothetical protein
MGLQIRNPITGNYLNPSGEWQSEAVDCATTGTFSIEFEVESIEECRGFTAVDLEVTTTSGSKFNEDELLLLPAINIAAVFGHNLGPVAAEVSRSDDGASWFTSAEMEIDQPSFYSLFADTYARYWSLFLEGTNHEPGYVGEYFLGYAREAPSPVQQGWKRTGRQQQARRTNDAGAVFRTAMAAKPMTGLQLDFKHFGPELEDFRRDIEDRSQCGIHPVIVIPDEDKPLVVLGVVEESFESSHETLKHETSSLTIEPLPGPIVAP